MAGSSDPTGEGRVCAAVRIDGELQPAATDIPINAIAPIYSLTKTLTAIGVLRLVETRTLGLDDTPRQLLRDPRLPPAITLTHLLRHMSGLRDYGPLPGYHEAVRTRPDRPWARDEFLNAVLRDGVLFPPGERFAYSNVGYMLLIDVLEHATGLSFRRVLDQLVVAPLALRNTAVAEEIDDLMRCVPGFGSEVSADGQAVDVRGRYHPGWCAPRVVTSTAEDVTRVFDALIAGEILDRETLTLMTTLSPLSEPDDDHAGGMGVFADCSSTWGPNYGHGGGGPGYDVCASVYPDTPRGRMSLAVFVTSSRGPRARDREAALLTELLGTAR